MRKIWSTAYFIFAAFLGGLIGLFAVLTVLLKEKSKGRAVSKREAFLQDKWRTMGFYKVLSKIYDFINPAFYDEDMRNTIVNFAHFTQEALVLDAGCGTGYTTKNILERLDGKGSVVAVDITPEQMKKAMIKMKNAQRVNFIRADIENLPFRKDVFDAVISAGAIEYLPNPFKAIVELSRVAKKKGRIVIAGPEHRWFKKIRIDRSLYSPPVEKIEKYFKKAGLNVTSHLIGPKTYLRTEEYAFVAVGEVL